MVPDKLVEPANPGQYGPAPVLDALGPDAKDLLLDVARKAVFESSGGDYFDGLAHFLYAVVGAELVVVGEIVPGESTSIQTIARYRTGERTPNKRYSAEGTPCGTVVGPQNLCIYPSGVAELFPDDTSLAKMGAQGYLGMPLFARDGRQIGILALVTTSPVADVETLASLLRLLGTRTSLELEYHVALDSAQNDASDVTRLLAAEDAKLRRIAE